MYARPCIAQKKHTTYTSNRQNFCVHFTTQEGPFLLHWISLSHDCCGSCSKIPRFVTLKLSQAWLKAPWKASGTRYCNTRTHARMHRDKDLHEYFNSTKDTTDTEHLTQLCRSRPQPFMASQTCPSLCSPKWCSAYFVHTATPTTEHQLHMLGYVHRLHCVVSTYERQIHFTLCA